MSYKVEANFESLPKGELVGLGFGIAVENGSSVEIDDETADLFKAETGKTVHEYFQRNKEVNVTSTRKGGDS